MPPAMNAVSAADLLRIRGERNKLLGGHLFLPGAWDILLYLQSAGAARPAQAICEALSMYAPNAERWLGVLLDEGLIAVRGAAEGAPAFGLTDRARCGLSSALRAGSH